ncbi:hypothetical protein [Haloarcula halobia]|uniref:hypothetical protein n=1 Tax=Haloarcula halobia TaxID=3033388 RepID=UPI0023ED1334|nr:hypothetical protein [Halomicroarcula sp. XH51]
MSATGRPRKERRAHAFQLPLTKLYRQADGEQTEVTADAADRESEHRLHLGK